MAKKVENIVKLQIPLVKRLQLHQLDQLLVKPESTSWDSLKSLMLVQLIKLV